MEELLNVKNMAQKFCHVPALPENPLMDQYDPLFF